MPSSKDLITRVDQIIELANKTLTTEVYSSGSSISFGNPVNYELFTSFRSAGLSFIRMLYGENHPFYVEFEREVSKSKAAEVKGGRAIFHAIKSEIEGGWLDSFKGIVSAEIFSDFLEMAEHLLDEGFKDPAAVMIGGVLEEHLRQLAQKNGLPIVVEKDGKEIPKRADVINQDLSRARVYTAIDQKSVTALLGLRNSAAHGHYNDYKHSQVEQMLRSVLDFISRHRM